MKIIVPAMKLHNDPKYHDDPEGFDPERFSSERKAEVRKGTYFPFGEGPRICVGKWRKCTIFRPISRYFLFAFSHEKMLDFIH